jgi:RNA polymerase sigma factor (sigma-70 family)
MGLVQLKTETDARALSRRFRQALIAFFVRRMHNHSEAEDLTQEVLMRVMERGAVIDQRGPDAYVFQIAANLLRDRSRRLKVRAAYRSGFGMIDADRVEELDPDRVIQSRHTLAAILKALNELPDRTRNIFVLFRLENMKQREIASALGLSVRTVEQHVIRASVHLKQCLESE